MSVKSFLPPNEEELLRPSLWRYWVHTPAAGGVMVYDRSWYRRALGDRVDGLTKGRDVERAFRDINAFERQLTDGGTVIVKFLLHISRSEQKKRFEKIQKDTATAWRVTSPSSTGRGTAECWWSVWKDIAQSPNGGAPFARSMRWKSTSPISEPSC